VEGNFLQKAPLTRTANWRAIARGTGTSPQRQPGNETRRHVPNDYR